MARFTVELRHLIDSGFDLEMDEYPIFSAAYRATLNQKILDHYWLREIGAETAARFRHFLKTEMNEIMPYYNKMYQSEALEALTVYDTEYHETVERQATGASTNVTAGNQADSSTDDLLSVSSETPQALVTAENIKKNVYAQKADREDNSRTLTRQTSQQSAASLNNLDNMIRHVYGNRTTNPATMLDKMRKNFLNIDRMIIRDLEPLFMGVYE